MDDTISRQQAIATAVSAAIGWHGLANPQYSIAYSIGEAMRALPSAQQWVPCSERLPEEEKAYLVTFASGNVGMSSWHKDTFNRGFNRGFDAYLTGVTKDGECEYFGVVAWMKKPEPWKGGPDEH